MNYFDVDPYLPRRARRAVAVCVLLGIVFLPGPTNRLIRDQIHERAAEITSTLDGLARTAVTDAFRVRIDRPLMKATPANALSASGGATHRKK